MNLSVIPKPKFIEEKKGFLNISEGLYFDKFPSNIENDGKDFLKLYNPSLNFIDKKIPFTYIEMPELSKESYILEILANKVIAYASKENGLFYALQTFKQLVNQFYPKLPCLRIEDSPKMEMRSYMIDVGRYFFPVSAIKRQIDYLSLFKINCLHWHLTEDQGWRIEILKYPRLTEIGSKRKGTNLSRKPHEGFYTQEQIKEIVDYAHKKYMIVIPEIDMPGHMRSAVASYPNLACFEREVSVGFKWGVKHDILCAGKESTFEFLENVLKEVFKLFPDGYIHLGGDEAVKTRWKICPHCQAKIKELSLNNEEELQTYFLNKVFAFVKKNGFKAIMWNQFEEGLLDIDLIWQYWTGTKDIQKVVGNRKIINGESVPYYLDLPYVSNSLKKVYEYEPILSEENKQNILGTELSLWTEYTKNQDNAERKTFPRLLAGVERSWSFDKDYDDFLKRATKVYQLLDKYEIKYYPIKNANPNMFLGAIQSFWWKLRPLHWEGLTNLIDNRKVEKLAKEAKNNTNKKV